MPDQDATVDTAAATSSVAADQSATTTTDTAAAATDASKTADTTTDTDAAKSTDAPEAYDFKAPEGKAFDADTIKVYSDVAKELGLSQEKAQTMLDKLAPVIEQRQIAKIEAIKTEWTEASKVDTEFGGAKLDENLSIAKQVIDKWATPEMKKLMTDSGLGNHPEMIRFCYRVGKDILPDTFVGGPQSGKGTPRTFNEMAAKLYGQ